MKKLINKYFWVILILIFGAIIFHYRYVFTTPYDNNYLRDLYDHSQWNMAISKRPVSDHIVYQVTGHDLVNTWSFFTIDPQTPVLGKYLFGYSIKLFNNPEIVNLLIFFLIVFSFYHLAKLVIKDDYLVKLATLILVIEPLIFYQISQTMLDLFQLSALLIHTFSILKLMSSKKHKGFWLIVGGISLGAFISIKIGFFALAIIMSDLYLFYRLKKIVYILPILILTGLTYLASYFPYFLQGHTIVDFMKSQKWIIMSYWMTSKAKPIIGMIFPSMITGYIKGWHENAVWERVKEWTILYPFYILFFIKSLKNKLLSKDLNTSYLSLLTSGLFFMYCLVPFNARYLVLLVPFFIIISIPYLAKLNKWLLIIITSIFVVQLSFFLRPNINVVNQLTTTWTNGAYQDLYSYIDNQSQSKISRYDFWRLGQTIEKNLTVINKEISIIIPSSIHIFNNQITGQLTINYYTKLGTITNQQPIKFIRQNDQWRIKWHDYFWLDQYQADDQIVSTIIDGYHGRLIDKNNKVLSEAVKWPILFVTHQQIKDESSVQQQLINLTGLKKHDIEYLYKANWPSDWPAEIGPLLPKYESDYLENLSLQPGISFNYQVLRIKNREAIIDYPGLDPTLGGSIMIIRDNKIKKVLIDRQVVNGQDYIYEKTN